MITTPIVAALAELRPGVRGRVSSVVRDLTGRAERLAALGVTPGAAVRVLQTFPGIIFECDQTEMAVERRVAAMIYIELTAAFPAAPLVRADGAPP